MWCPKPKALKLTISKDVIFDELALLWAKEQISEQTTKKVETTIKVGGVRNSKSRRPSYSAKFGIG